MVLTEKLLKVKGVYIFFFTLSPKVSSYSLIDIFLDFSSYDGDGSICLSSKLNVQRRTSVCSAFQKSAVSDLHFIFLAHNDEDHERTWPVSNRLVRRLAGPTYLDGCSMVALPVSPVTSWLSAFVYVALWRLRLELVCVSASPATTSPSQLDL